MRSILVAVAVFLVVAAGAVVLRPSAQANIAGLWSLWPDARSDGDNVLFYFFHEDGIGLYRYGKIGLNTTNSFDWSVDGGDLVLKFRKTGETVRTPFHLDGKQLVLDRDPKEPLTGKVRYTYVPPSQAAPDVFGKIPGRLWIDQKKFATGGMGFSLYQLKDAAIDGRGVGWHHVGDFDDWSTEALTYRLSPSSMELDFTVRGDHSKTPIQKDGDVLTFVEDPRDYWHVHAYKDAGPSFGSFHVDN